MGSIAHEMDMSSARCVGSAHGNTALDKQKNSVPFRVFGHITHGNLSFSFQNASVPLVGKGANYPPEHVPPLLFEVKHIPKMRRTSSYLFRPSEILCYMYLINAFERTNVSQQLPNCVYLKYKSIRLY